MERKAKGFFSYIGEKRYIQIANRLKSLQVERIHIEQKEKDGTLSDKSRAKLLERKEKVTSEIDKYEVKLAKRSFERTVEKESVSKDFDLNKEREQGVIQRDHAKSKLIEDFVDIYANRLKSKELLKICFFAITMLLFMGVIIGSALFLKELIAKAQDLDSWTFVPGCITGIGGIVTSLIILPQIIGQYLYDSSENEEISSLLTNIFESDQGTSKELLHKGQGDVVEDSEDKEDEVIPISKSAIKNEKGKLHGMSADEHRKIFSAIEQETDNTRQKSDDGKK